MEAGVIGAGIARARRRRGLSQEKLAQAIGVSRGTVQNWERGAHTPGVDDVWRIADALDTSVDALIGRQAEGEEAAGPAAGLSSVRYAGRPVTEVLEELLALLAREQEQSSGRAEGGRGA